MAALAVVIHHVSWDTGVSQQGALAGVLSRLNVGVPLFFALSGFLLFRPWVLERAGTRGPVDVQNYLWRRVVRIFPAFLLVCAVVTVLSPESRAMPASTWLATLALQQNLVVPLSEQLPSLTQTWSLSTEVGFYLLLPLLAGLVLRRRPVAALAVLAGVGVAWTALANLSTFADLGSPGMWPPAFGDWFAGGMVLAWWTGRPEGPPAWLRNASRQRLWWWGGALGLWLLMTLRFFGSYDMEPTPLLPAVLAHVAYGAVAAMVLIPLVYDPRPAPFLVTWTGTLSYGVFLWHVPILKFVRPELIHHSLPSGFVPTFVLVLTASVVAAWLSWTLLEHPLMRSLRRPRDLRRLVPFRPAPECAPPPGG